MRISLLPAALVFAVLGAVPIADCAIAQKQQLRVMTIERPPFVVQRGTGYIGYSIELWNHVARELEIEFTLVEAHSFSNMLKQVQNGEADVAVANISITAEREQTMDFSHPIFNSGLQIMVPTSAAISESVLATIWSSGILKVLAVAAFTLFIVAQFFWLSERKLRKNISRRYQVGIWQALWWTASTVLGHGYRAPNSVSGRIVALIWMLFGLFLVSVFVAEITSALTIRNLQSNISGPDDLPGRHIVTVNGSTADRYLTYNNISVLRVDSPDTIFTRLLEGEADAAVFDAPILAYHAANEGKGQVRLVGPVFQPEQFGFALRSESPYREAINHALLSLWENGTVQHIYDDWFSGITKRR